MARKVLVALGIVLLMPIVLWCVGFALYAFDIRLRYHRYDMPNGAWFQVRTVGTYGRYMHYFSLVRLMHPDGRVLVERTVITFCFDGDVVEGYAVVPDDRPEGGPDRYFYYRRGADEAVIIPVGLLFQGDDMDPDIAALPDKPCGGRYGCAATFVFTADIGPPFKEANAEAIERCAREPAL